MGQLDRTAAHGTRGGAPAPVAPGFDRRIVFGVHAATVVLTVCEMAGRIFARRIRDSSSGMDPTPNARVHPVKVANVRSVVQQAGNAGAGNRGRLQTCHSA